MAELSSGHVSKLSSKHKNRSYIGFRSKTPSLTSNPSTEYGETDRVSAVVLKWGGANTLQGGRDVTDGKKKKTTADLSLVSESSIRGEMQGAGLTQTNQ